LLLTIINARGIIETEMNMNLFTAALFLSYAVAGNITKLEIKSSAFQNGAKIPARYTCDSLNLSPSLSWTGAPAETKSFALILEDPDAPSGTFIHWVIFNIPKEKNGLGENVPKKELLADGTAQGKNGAGRTGYTGPCPPPGKPHRYLFELYCLDTKLSLKQPVSKTELETAMKGHILAEAQVFGTYQR
jgi:Raf kinase inhibitor-like YbhB/YbcL family protein